MGIFGDDFKKELKATIREVMIELEEEKKDKEDQIQQMDYEPYLDTNQVSELFGWKARTIRAKCREAEMKKIMGGVIFPFHRDGPNGHLRFKKSEIDAYLANESMVMPEKIKKVAS